MIDHERIWQEFEGAFEQRHWRSIRASWPQFVGKPAEPPGSPPELTLSELLEQGGVLMTVPEKGKLTCAAHPRGEIPELVFREGVFWLHKASHVLGAAEAHVEKGFPTWSLSAAYQSAYFAARAILAFLGVGVAELERVSVTVDLCRDMRGVRPQKMERIGAFEENVQLRSLGVLFDHRQIWLLLQRILRTTTCSIWPEGWSAYLSHVEVGSLTKQRHGLHYQLQYWVLEDLHDFVYSASFSDVAATGSGRDLFDRDKPNFSLIAGSVLTRMALALFKDICDLTNRLIEERRVILAAFSQERHPLFGETLRRDFSSATTG